MPQGKQLTLGEHLAELRLRLIHSLIFLIIAFIVSFFLQEQVIYFILKPHLDTMEELQLSKKLYAFTYPETFMAYFKINILFAIIISIPFGLWEMWRFIRVGLYPKEKKSVLTWLPISFILFLSGVIFGYFYLIPTAYKFLAAYSTNKFIDPLFNLNNYLSLFVILTLAVGLSFELPLMMLFFSAIGLTSSRFYLAKLKIAIVLIFIFAAVITPTGDPFTMTIMALPLIGLYLFGILLIRLIIKRAN